MDRSSETKVDHISRKCNVVLDFLVGRGLMDEIEVNQIINPSQVIIGGGDCNGGGGKKARNDKNSRYLGSNVGYATYLWEMTRATMESQWHWWITVLGANMGNWT